jgi:hypothetical protein
MADHIAPIFFFDIDGVLLDLSSSFSKYTRRLHPLGTGELDWRLAWEGFLLSSDAACLPALLSVVAFNAFADKHDVWLITGFPEEQRVKRVENLARHGFRYKGIYFVPTLAKADFILHQTVGRQVVFIEDDPEPLLQLGRLLPDAKLLQFSRADRVYEHSAALIRIDSWEDFLAQIEPVVSLSCTQRSEDI